MSSVRIGDARSQAGTAAILESVLRSGRGAGRESGRGPDGARGGSTAAGDSEVSLSPRAREASQGQRFQREVLASFERGLSAEELEIFEQAGRSDYLSSIAGETDTSAEATAQRILGGVTGYIFGAFRLSRGELGAGDIDEFEREALRGFERGLGQARELIEGLGALTGDLDADISETARLVRDGIRSFAEEQREAL